MADALQARLDQLTEKRKAFVAAGKTEKVKLVDTKIEQAKAAQARASEKNGSPPKAKAKRAKRAKP